MIKTISSYDKIALDYHKHVLDKNNFLNKYVEEPGTLEKLKELDLKNIQVLDLGCGSGRYTKILKEMGSDVIGVDPSSELLKIARKQVRDVHFLKAKAGKLPFKDNQFDLVFAGMVMHYIDDVNQSFKEISRVLKPLGRFILTSHVPYLELAIKNKFDKNSYYSFDNYFKEGGRVKKWSSIGVQIKFYHHTMETIFKAALNNSLSLSDFRDFKPSKKGKEIDPEDYEEVLNKSKFYLAEFTKM